MEAELACLLVVEAVQLGIRGSPVVSVRSRDVAVERDAHGVDHRPHTIVSLSSRNPGTDSAPERKVGTATTALDVSRPGLTRQEPRNHPWRRKVAAAEMTSHLDIGER